MGTRIYVGNLSYDSTDESLRQLFAQSGHKVVDVHIVTDRATGRSRGFGFVEMSDQAATDAAIAQLDGAVLDGRRLTLREALPRPGSAGPGRSSGADRVDGEASEPGARPARFASGPGRGPRGFGAVAMPERGPRPFDGGRGRGALSRDEGRRRERRLRDFDRDRDEDGGGRRGGGRRSRDDDEDW
ncbi:MAG: RNA-binding protein [Myxococcota bacterium]|nr:RNA-binding protein [Myxococcota bacterium]MDW8361590.1 RNA-binding protein [Myxococcales bacterium]